MNPKSVKNIIDFNTNLWTLDIAVVSVIVTDIAAFFYVFFQKTPLLKTYNILVILQGNGRVKNNMNMVSVILPVYNSERYLSRTITSILQQTMPNFELLAIDDCSMDSSLQILQRWAEKDSRIQIIRNTQNQGVANVRNIGIQSAHGNYIAFVDSDDTWQSTKLEQQLQFMEQSGCDFSCTAYSMVNNEGEHLKNRMLTQKMIFLEDLLKENYICCSTVMLKAEVAKQHNMDGDYNHEDYVYWLELLQSGVKGHVLNQCLTRYRLAQTSRSADKLKAAKGRWQVYRQYLGYSIGKTTWYFVHYAMNGFKKYKK